jgi:hypothetical protein
MPGMVQSSERVPRTALMADTARHSPGSPSGEKNWGDEIGGNEAFAQEP